MEDLPYSAPPRSGKDSDQSASAKIDDHEDGGPRSCGWRHIRPLYWRNGAIAARIEQSLLCTTSCSRFGYTTLDRSSELLVATPSRKPTSGRFLPRLILRGKHPALFHAKADKGRFSRIYSSQPIFLLSWLRSDIVQPNDSDKEKLFSTKRYWRCSVDHRNYYITFGCILAQTSQ